MSDNEEIEMIVGSTVKPVLIIYLPRNTNSENLAEVANHFKDANISKEYHVLGIKSNAREEVEIKALYPQDFDTVGLEELKKQIGEEVMFIVK